MSENIKSTATTAAGYIYQNQQGLKVLCDWLDAPSRYSRVKFECGDEDIAPTGLDDIVVERSDGNFDLKQVKFTPDPDRNLLSWDWMLEKKGKSARSRSPLRKWFDAFKKLDPMRIGNISLSTNRRPDSAIEACLEDGKISLARIPELKRSEVIAELDCAIDCELFFKHLCIQHSDKGYSALEHNIIERLRKHGTPEGIERLRATVTNWATLKNEPHPDGWITLEHVRTILRALPPAPLPEDFAVPNGYEVPDQTFHSELLQDVTKAGGKVIVLTGSPGRGKSTYLSALCDTLSESDIPTVRHHYFLSTTERDRDRVNSGAVEDSIKAQINKFHHDVPVLAKNLRACLEACASHYKGQGKPFVLVLDGLDHVWRTNAKDKQPLDDLFSQIIPCPDNMVLLVGTQSVSDSQLPTDLLASAPKAEWRELPSMSENAVLSYLRKAVQEGRLTMSFEDNKQAEQELRLTASLLCAKTNGHPLHVIYATSELEHAGRSLSAWDVKKLKGDLSKDAYSYYASLWYALPPSLQDVLRLVCAFSFFWPKKAFPEVADILKTATPDIGNVEHLLHSSAAGLKVFHESLAVFVRATSDYEERINELMPAVAQWLEKSAPASLRVNWLWTVQAKLGDPRNLITGLTRNWVMLRREEGYPEVLFDTLLSNALISALDNSMFADAYRLNHLKARMVGGSQFQMQDGDQARLTFLTLALTKEKSVIHEAIASRHETDILGVVALGLALRFRGDQVMAEICGQEALRRLKSSNRFANKHPLSSEYDEFQFLIHALSRLNSIGATPATLRQIVERNNPDVWLPRVRMLIEEGNLDDLMMGVAPFVKGITKNIISDACIRAAANAGASITERDDFNTLARTPLVATVEAVLAQCSRPLYEPIPADWISVEHFQQQEDLAVLAHHWFFSAVQLKTCMILEGGFPFEYTGAPFYEDRENISDLLNCLSDFADNIADRWSRREFVDFEEIFTLFETIEFGEFHKSYNQVQACEYFKEALHHIACDIRLVSILLNNEENVAIDKNSITAAMQCAWFDRTSFRAQYAAGSLTRMTDDAAAQFLSTQRTIFDAEIREDTSASLQTPLQLCAIALAHGLKDDARALCRQTWELATGYGHRKDPTLSYTVDAIGHLVGVAAKDACRLLACIAPQIHHVLDYTDGKGTRHVLADADQILAKLNPSALVTKYEEHVHSGEWWSAENSLEAYVEQAIKDQWPLDALMRTGLHPKIYESLQNLARKGDANAAKLLHVLQEHNGWNIGLLQQQEYPGSDLKGTPYDGDVTAFGPDQLDSLLESLPRGYDERTLQLRAWYMHWDTQGRGRELLVTLDNLLLSREGQLHEAQNLWDLAFDTKRRLSGKKTAWKYLVQAQTLRGGWLYNMENEKETRRRLDLVYKYYPDRCDEFVAKTTYSMFENSASPRIAPDALMVYFYVRQGRITDAVTFTESMINCAIEDTRTLPLEQPLWAAELSSSTDPGA